MARNQKVSIATPVPDGAQMTELTADDATKITLKNIGGNMFELFGSATSSEPDPTSEDGIPVLAGEGLVGYALSDIFPGVAGVVRVFAYSQYEEAQAFVSHD